MIYDQSTSGAGSNHCSTFSMQCDEWNKLLLSLINITTEKFGMDEKSFCIQYNETAGYIYNVKTVGPVYTTVNHVV